MADFCGFVFFGIGNFSPLRIFSARKAIDFIKFFKGNLLQKRTFFCIRFFAKN